MNKDQRTEKKRNLRLVDKYDNDDYSRFAGPDFEERPFEIGEEDFNQSPHTDKRNVRLRSEGNWHHPGVSGKRMTGIPGSIKRNTGHRKTSPALVRRTTSALMTESMKKFVKRS